MKKINQYIPLFLFLSPMAHAMTANQFETNFYGFLKASSIYSSEALSSFNNINMSAPTNATPKTRSQDDHARLSFQTQQSRFGVQLKKEEKLEAKLEFDLIDFGKSSPTTQMVPRVRIASATYKPDENSKIILGQDWDLFSPVTSYTFDIVGLYFLAGNSGFMRSQAQYIRSIDKFEVGAALGLAGNNPGVADTDLEMAETPTYSARLSYKIDGSSRIGVSAIKSQLQYVTGNDSKHQVYGANAFYEQVFSRLQLKSELYAGKNLANIGALTIGKGNSTSDIKEHGGFVTGIFNLNDHNAMSSGVGFAKVDNKNQVAAFSLSAAGAINNAGIVRNQIARIGYEHKFSSDFSWMSELSYLETANMVATAQIAVTHADTLETGILLKF